MPPNTEAYASYLQDLVFILKGKGNKGMHVCLWSVRELDCMRVHTGVLLHVHVLGHTLIILCAVIIIISLGLD